MRVQDENLIFEPTSKKVSVTAKKEFKSKLFNVEDFKSALSESLEYSRLFTISAENSDYEINAVMTHWFQPPAGLIFHTDLIVKYSIKDKDSVIFEKEIKTNYLHSYYYKL